METKEVVSDFAVGDVVKIVDGALSGFLGQIESIDLEQKKVQVVVSMFGRETPVELELWQIQAQ